MPDLYVYLYMQYLHVGHMYTYVCIRRYMSRKVKLKILITILNWWLVQFKMESM